MKRLDTGGDGTASLIDSYNIDEKVMTKKDIKKRDEIADAISTKDMKDRYGDKNVKYAIATKIVMDKKKKKKKDMSEQLGGVGRKEAPLPPSKISQKRTQATEKEVNKNEKKSKEEMNKVVMASYDMEQGVTESDLIIQDWNKDDIKFTEIETVDVIKPKPLKEEHSNWRLDEKFRMIPKAFGKTVILGTGSSRMMGKSPRLSRGASINLAINKNMGITKDIMNLSKQADDIAPTTFPRDVARKIKKKTNPNAVFPTVAQNKIKGDLMKGDEFKNITTRDFIKKKKNIKKKNDDGGSLMASYDWREELGEDWQKVNRQDKTDGLSKKAVKAYRRENPGSKLKTAVTKDPKKLKKGSKDAKRRLSFCRRMKGMKKRLTSAKTARDPDSRINKALRRWNC